MSIAPEDEAARAALAGHLSDLRRWAAELGFAHLEAAVSEALTTLEREAFGPASLRAIRVLAWRYEPLAALPAQSGTHPAVSPPAEPSLRGRHILVADDDAEVRWFYVGVLRESGARVMEARDGIEALELARRESPDVILADIVMPRLDGLALCAAVRREPLLDGVPVVLLSWRDDFLHRMRELRADAQGYLRKEVPARQVLDRVLGVLEPLKRLEGALKGDREARGDLEELGVTRLLQAVRRLRPNASVVLQDPWSLFDLELREGHIVGLTRTAIDGAVKEGAEAFPALVGMSSGRFVVAALRAGLGHDVPESLDDSFIEATRRLGTFLDTIAEHPNCRVEFDPDVLGTYVRHSPIRVQRLIAALVAGGPPDVLWESGAGSRALVDALLITLARQGAIRNVSVPGRVSSGGTGAAPSPESGLELNQAEIEQDSLSVSDPIKRQNVRAQSAVAMHREPANRAPSWSYPVWRLGSGTEPGSGESSSGFGMELRATPRLFGLAFLVLLSATVAFLIWNEMMAVGAPAGSPGATAPPIEIGLPVEVRVNLEGPAPKAVPPVSPVGLDLSAFSGRLRAGVDPSLDVAEGQGALELSGPGEVSVEVDGVDRGTLPLTLVLDEGTHRVRYRLGAQSTDRFYNLKPGATRVLQVVTQPGGFVDAR
ncbi:MAG: response regulator [Polyangiales bacterium]